MSWPNQTIGNYFDLKHGYAFKGEFFGSAGNFVIVTPGSFHEAGGFRERGEKSKFYTQAPPDEFVLCAGDLIVAMTEQAEGLLGSSALVPTDNYYLHNQRIGLVVDLNSAKLDTRFLYYLFNTKSVRAQIRATATGTKVKHTAPKRIRAVQAPLPPVDTQTRIADILSAYDDLIENNNRRMALLEEAIHLLYREWFVYLRFPGHERVKVVDGVPEGWSIKTLPEITSAITRGVSPKYDDDSTERAVNQRCIRDGRINLSLARRHKAKVTDLKRLERWDVLVNSTGVGTLGRVAQLTFDAEQLTVDTHITILRPKPNMNSVWFGAAMSAIEPLFTRMGQGATGQTELRRKDLEKVGQIVPSASIQAAFGEIAEPIRSETKLLDEQNQRLREARDLLLPRLMNGSIAV